MGAETSVTEAIDSIMAVFRHSFILQNKSIETEYMQKEGLPCLSRVVKAPNPTANNLAVKTNPQEPDTRPFRSETHRALQLNIRDPGQLDTLYFKDDESDSIPLAPDEVLIKVHAVGLSLADVKIALGQLSGDKLGSECAGVVLQIGEDVENFIIGDRVCCCTNSSAFSSNVRAQASQVVKIPADCSYSNAAALPIAFCVASWSLLQWALLQKGKSVLIQSGAEPIGQAAIQMAKLQEAEIYVTVDSEESKDLLIDEYGLQASHVFASTERRSVTISMRTISAVDVVLNSSSGEGWKEAWSYLKPFGRLINYQGSNMRPDVAISAQKISSISVDIRLILEKGNAIVRAAMSPVGKLIETRSISAPEPLRIHELSELAQAFKSVQRNHLIGKTVVEVDDAVLVAVS